MNNSENKTDSFLTQEAKDVIQELLEINSGGGGGGTSDYDDLTNKPSINGVSLSGDMSADDLGLAETSDIPDVSGLYTKPNDGIPKSDLASDVKTSLGKADTALQSFTETDPTVPSWAKAVNKPTYTASEVGALPVGTPIPSVDNTLTTQGAAADAKATGDAIDEATNAINNINSEMVKSVNNQTPDNDGNVNVAVDQTLVDNWLDEHPEATTTVQDGSITYSKLNSEVSGDISGLKNALNNIDAQINGGQELVPVEKTVSDFTTKNFYISPNTGKWVSGNNRGYFISLGDTVKISITGRTTYGTEFAFLSSDTCVDGEMAAIIGSDRPTAIMSEETEIYTVPSGALYLYFRNINPDGYPMFPSALYFYHYVQVDNPIVTRLDLLESNVTSLDADINGSAGYTEDVTSTLTWVDGYGVDSRNGNPSYESGYSYTNVPLNSAQMVSGYTRGGQEYSKGYAFLTSNGTYISGDGHIGSGTYDWYYNLEVPENAGILRICCNTSYKSNFSCILTFGTSEGLKRRVETIEEEIASISVETDKTLSIDGEPADAKAVGDAINNIIGSEDSWLIVDNFDVGTLYVENGQLNTAANNKRIRTKPSAKITMKQGDKIGLTSYTNYRFIMFSSSDGNTWTQGQSWLTSDYTIPSDGYYCFVVDDETGATHTTPNSLFDLITFVSSAPESIVQRIDREISELNYAIRTPKIAHLSFDDVRYCMEDITANANTYASIFDNDFFAMLKDLHDTYGTVVSLYLFITNSGSGIAGYTTKFAGEFAKNADWLKFGLHQGGTNYENTTAQQAKDDYDTFTENIVNIAGTVEAIDRCPRLGNFAGNSESMIAMRDADAGIVGLLSAYDNRDSYYLSSADSAYVYKHGRLYDFTNRLVFFRSLMAIETVAPSSTLPPLRTLSGANGSNYAILMMHEYGVYDNTYSIIPSMVERLDYACDWAKQNGYLWDFPMNRILR